MPELPEVETVRRSLAGELVGRYFESCCRSRLPLREPFSAARWRAHVQGRMIVELRRRGKFLILDCAGGGSLLIHLGMSGRLLLQAVDAPPERHTHWRGRLDNGRELRLRDPRRFGLVWAGSTSKLETDSPLAGLGPEPLDPPIRGSDLAARARGSTRPIKAWLLDGTGVAGLGNIYATEALFRAGIHPERRTFELTKAAWGRLAGAMVEVLEGAIQCGGTTLRDFHDGSGQRGTFQQHLQVYGRSGEPCLVCSLPLVDLRVGGRSTVCCLRCQT